MKFIWDRRKNEANISKHELDFADAYKVFESPMLIGLDEREIMAKIAGSASV
jgi:uncharacterized DUF497 family protein